MFTNKLPKLLTFLFQLAIMYQHDVASYIVHQMGRKSLSTPKALLNGNGLLLHRLISISSTSVSLTSLSSSSSLWSSSSSSISSSSTTTNNSHNLNQIHKSGQQEQWRKQEQREHYNISLPNDL